MIAISCSHGWTHTELWKAYRRVNTLSRARLYYDMAKRFSKRMQSFVEAAGAMRTIELFDELMELSRGDDYEGAFTGGGWDKFEAYRLELRSRLPVNGPESRNG